jgi:hypothetical protein
MFALQLRLQPGAAMLKTHSRTLSLHARCEHTLTAMTWEDFEFAKEEGADSGGLVWMFM